MPFETFDLSSIRELLKLDPTLALAALRIEIERKLKSAAIFLNLNTKNNLSISQVTEALKTKQLLSLEQFIALRKIVNMCNRAIHGISIKAREAKEVIDLTEQLNKSFPLGYSVDFLPNSNYANQNLICEWEHCIEQLPLTGTRTQRSCPVFGHDCPGGAEKVAICGKTIKGISNDRFASK